MEEFIEGLPQRQKSSLLGVALGDGLGYPWELHEPEQEDIRVMTNKRGELVISDDTQMALALIAALDKINSGKIQDVVSIENVIVGEFLDYAVDEDNNRGAGLTVMGSLMSLYKAGKGAHWRDHASRVSPGCGSVMRAFPTILNENTTNRLGLTVRQGQITHNSPHTRAATALLSHVALTSFIFPVESLFDHAKGVKESAFIAADQLLSDMEKRELVEDFDAARIPGTNIGFNEALRRAEEICVPHLHKILDGDDGVYQAGHDNIVCELIGDSFDGLSAVVSAFILVELYRTRDDVSAWDILNIAVQWFGDRDSRAAIAGGIIGALYEPSWGEGEKLVFELRYDSAIREYKWGGFDAPLMNIHPLYTNYLKNDH